MPLLYVYCNRYFLPSSLAGPAGTEYLMYLVHTASLQL